MPILADANSHAQAFRGRMRLGGRMVRAELRMLTHDACFARDRLVAFDLALSARIASLEKCQCKLLQLSEGALIRESLCRHKTVLRRLLS